MKLYIVDLVIFARFQLVANFARINSRIQESHEIIITILAVLEKKEKFSNSKLREKSQIRNSRKFKHTKINRFTVYNETKGVFNLVSS